MKGKKLAVRVYDDQGKPEEAANAVTRLITQDKVLLILGEVASHQLAGHGAQGAGGQGADDHARRRPTPR